MAKAKKTTVMKKTGYEATMMPKYNPYQTGHGVHQTDKTPTRAKQKRLNKKIMKEYE